MAITFLDLYTWSLGNDFDSSTYLTRAKQGIWDGMRDVARQVHLPLDETTAAPTIVAGTSSYTLPADTVRLLSVADTVNDIQYAEVEPEWIDLQNTAVRGQPYLFALFGGAMTLFPTPDRAYTVVQRYLKLPTLPTLDADVVTFIPDEYQMMLVSFARASLFKWEDDPEMSNFWQADYLTKLSRYKGDLQRRTVGASIKRVPGPYRLSTSPRFTRP